MHRGRHTHIVCGVADCWNHTRGFPIRPSRVRATWLAEHGQALITCLRTPGPPDSDGAPRTAIDLDRPPDALCRCAWHDVVVTRPTMKWWLNLAFEEVRHYIPLAEVAEACGFDGVVVSDHLLSPAQMASDYPYSPGGQTLWSPEADWPDCWVMIAAMAARTERLRFATSIYIAPLREPFSLAKAIGTASILSGGRVVCGVGTGWMAEEFDAVGVPFAGRARRLDEMLEIMTALWTGDLVEHHGATFDFPSVQMRPAPASAVPIYVGGHAERALQRAVRHDGWIAAHQTVETTAADVARVEAMLLAAGRDRTLFAIMATLSARRHIADSGGLAEAGVDAVAVPAAVIERHPDLDVKVAALRAFASEHIHPR